MNDKLEILLNDSKFDSVIGYLQSIITPDHDKYDQFKKICRTWGAFRQGLAMKYYRLSQIENAMKADFRVLIEGLEIDNAVTGNVYKSKNGIEQGASELPLRSLAGFGLRFITTLIDTAFSVTLFIIVFFAIKHYYSDHSTFPIFVTILSICLINIFIVSGYGGTLGNLTLGLQVHDDHGNKLSIWKALLRVCPYIIIATVMLLALQFKLSGIEQNNLSINQSNSDLLSITYNMGLMRFAKMFVLFAIFDFLSIVVSEKRRAFHDSIAKSYVSYKLTQS